jgi:hypothetical protein
MALILFMEYAMLMGRLKAQPHQIAFCVGISCSESAQWLQ